MNCFCESQMDFRKIVFFSEREFLDEFFWIILIILKNKKVHKFNNFWVWATLKNDKSEQKSVRLVLYNFDFLNFRVVRKQSFWAISRTLIRGYTHRFEKSQLFEKLFEKSDFVYEFFQRKIQFFLKKRGHENPLAEHRQNSLKTGSPNSGFLNKSRTTVFHWIVAFHYLR